MRWWGNKVGNQNLLKGIVGVCVRLVLGGCAAALLICAASPDHGATTLGPGDVLAIKVFNVPELEQSTRIGDNGEASFSLLGEMHVAGLTASELERQMEKQYRDRDLVRDPHVTVLVTEYATQGISIIGEVAKPGTYPLIGPHTVVNILSSAGGLTQLAGGTVSIRRQDGTERTVLLDANDPKNALAQDVAVFPGDKIVVARASLVYVVGDVGKPGGFQMQDNGRLSALQALALASGANRTASLGRARLIHHSGTSYSESAIDLNRVLHGKANDVQLSANDILFVPNSRLKSAVASGFGGAVQAASTAAIYHP